MRSVLNGTLTFIVVSASMLACATIVGIENMSLITPLDDAGDPDARDELRGEIVDIAAGRAHACALTRAGLVYCWGNNVYGQLGHPADMDETCLSGTDSFRCNSTPTLVSNLENITKIVAGLDTTCAIERNGSLWCWGSNEFSLLGRQGGDSAESGIPYRWRPTNVTVASTDGNTPAVVEMDIARMSACAVLDGGAVVCWGTNELDVFGNGAARLPAYATTPVASLISQGATTVSLSSYQTACAVLADSSVMCWGHNRSGELGHAPGGGSPTDQNGSNSTPQRVPSLAATRIASADGSVCALRKDAKVACWGWNGVGALGRGLIDDGVHAEPVAIDVDELSDVVELVGKHDTMCARRADGDVFCWGNGTLGQLGNGVGVGPEDAGPNATGTTGGSVTLVSGVGGGRKCLRTSSSATGTALQLWDCDGSNTQRWTLAEAGVIRGPGGSCVGVRDDAVETYRADVELQDCDGRAAQSWNFTDMQLKANESMCVDVNSSQTANGTPIQLWECNSTAAQQWTPSSTRAFYFPRPVKLPNVKATRIVLGQTMGAAIDPDGNVWTWGENTSGELGHTPGIEDDQPCTVNSTRLCNPTPRRVHAFAR